MQYALTANNPISHHVFVCISKDPRVGVFKLAHTTWPEFVLRLLVVSEGL
jgi:hypothetical protein